MRTVVFDLDGTLADTSGDLIAAANACLATAGHPPQLDPAQDMLTAFAGGRAMLRLALSRIGPGWTEADIDAHFPVFLQAYAGAIDVTTRLYPGAVGAVEALRSAGFTTAICTNKPEGLARTLCQRLGITDLFGALVGADTLPVRKPDPAPYRAAVQGAGGDPSRSILIGDTVTDRDTARAAGVPVVLVAFGPEGAGVARLAPDALLAHYDDLPALAGRLLP
ncbi:HAD-IA family hydrolase [Szabonella alba]|uniref:phosphoglycolate phosphatase n=1 Tax=Szabonella alba TaxID=2804194 RepID=A0A8K0Y298_9RHOB|nr:HAD-IA family hydrolase [Szabonella alba]MBL4917149.1 HAD-IA family hydrolase [Szabonella alba]